MDALRRVRLALCLLLCAVSGFGGCTAKKTAIATNGDFNEVCDETADVEPAPVGAEAGRCGDGVAAQHVFACADVWSGGCGSASIIDHCCASIVEGCDGADVRGQSCESLGFASGQLRCNECVLDARACTRCDPSVAATCSSWSVPAHPKGYPAVASWRSHSVVWIDDRVYPIDRDLQRQDPLELGPVRAMAPLGRLGVLLAHDAGSGNGLEISAWRGGTTVHRNAVDLGTLVQVNFVPVPDRPGWLYVSSGSKTQPSYLLDARGRSTEVPSGDVDAALWKLRRSADRRSADRPPADAPFSTPGLSGTRSVASTAFGERWTFYQPDPPFPGRTLQDTSGEPSALLTVLQSSARDDGVLWLSHSVWETSQDARALYTGASSERADTSVSADQAVQRFADEACLFEPISPIPPVIDLPLDLELAFVRR